ncbi:PTS sugar transporter subunit IIA [Erwinia mallotivora]|uniref:PTS EIIA type-2 domain-containing protein n=1 Tax=Erwinia mallotivora TaxID=69222 RepID=A0A014NJG6_9GAMM|nr:PTS sugar transporter subunit IIA [Erwinia mallotivora]EXU73945.1 hypothetical protein BG55_19965 [Erwinia mallotivora]
MQLNSLLDARLLHLHQAPLQRDVLFRQIAGQLLSEELVTESYADALIAREQDHPTAMPLETMGVAIPHVDIEHIRQPKLVVVTCPEGIEFYQAEDPELTMRVQVIFFLLLNEKDAHLEFLMKLISLFQKTDEMNQLLSSASREAVMQLLANNLA